MGFSNISNKFSTDIILYYFWRMLDVIFLFKIIFLGVFLLKKGSLFFVHWYISFTCYWKILFKVIKITLLFLFPETTCVRYLFFQVYAYEDMCQIFVFLWRILLWGENSQPKTFHFHVAFYCKWKLLLILYCLVFSCKNPPFGFCQSWT